MQAISRKHLVMVLISALSFYQCAPEQSTANADEPSENSKIKTRITCEIGPDRICRFPVQELNTEYDATGYSVIYKHLRNEVGFKQVKVIFSNDRGVVHTGVHDFPDAMTIKTYPINLKNFQKMELNLLGASAQLPEGQSELKFDVTGAMLALSEQTVSTGELSDTELEQPDPPSPPVTDKQVFAAFNFSKVNYQSAQNVFSRQISSMATPKNISGESLVTRSQVELEPLRRTQLKNGTVVTRYQQLVHGLPVANGDLTLTQNGQRANLSGQYLSAFQSKNGDPEIFKDELLPRLEKNEGKFKNIAINAFKDKFNDDASAAKIGKEKYSHYLRQVDDSLALTTSVSFIFRGENGLRNPIVIIDTATQEVLDVEDGVRRLDDEATGHGGNRNTGRYIYGAQYFPKLKIRKDGTECFLENNTIEFSNGIVTNDFNLTDETDALPFGFNCSIENRNEEFAVPQMGADVDWDTASVNAYSPLNDAHAFAGLVMEMFSDQYAYFYDALTISSDYPKLTLLAHVTDGESAEYALDTIYIQDGKPGQSFPTAVPDIIAHEMGHWFSDLWRQSKGFTPSISDDFKAIEESYSDMLGVVTDQYLIDTYNFPSLSVGKIGESIYPNGANYVRDICNPNWVSHIGHINNGMSSHDKAGLFNKVFCELSKKDGWTFYKSFEVFTHAHLFHWDYGQNFEQAALQVRTSALTLGYDAQSIGEAFKTVGICLPGFVGCDQVPLPPGGDVRTYTLTERLMLTENSTNYCPMNDDICYQEKCKTIFNANFTKVGCFSEGNNFLCAVECQSKVRL